MVEAKSCREQRFQANGTGFCICKGKTLGVDILRIMGRNDNINCSIPDCFNHRQTIFLAAQRRRKTKECPELANIVFVE
ncbi:hypothetical protein D9M69_674300 [compost metagenome]